MKHLKLFEDWNSLNEDIDIDALKSEAKKIKHCGDYGRLFINKNDNTVYWVAGDADGGTHEDPGHETTKMDDIAKMLKVKGVKEVKIEAESSPDEEDGYEEIEFE